jgi:hypothetical protein
MATAFNIAILNIDMILIEQIKSYSDNADRS